MSEILEQPTGHPRDIVETAALVFQIGAAYDSYTSQIRRALSLNAHERLALSALWASGAMTMTELRARIPLSRAAVTTLVDRLEANGLVHRRSDESDRRRRVVVMSEATATRMRPVVRPWAEELHEIVHRRSPGEWETISRFLAEFRALNEQQAEQLASMSDEQLQALASASDTSGEQA